MSSAKINLQFLDIYDENDFIEVEKYQPDSKLDSFLNITGSDDLHVFSIYLDIPTAIKFAKTLRTEINKAKGGTKNG